MIIEKTNEMCIGYVRLACIDVGFDLRWSDTYVALPDEWPAELVSQGCPHTTGVGFDREDGRYLVWGSREEISRELIAAGYKITTNK
jgi:hypothetical protein